MILDWLRVYRSKNIGPISFYSIFKKYKNAGDALSFLATKKIDIASQRSVEEEIERTHKFGARIIFFTDTEYPDMLKQCPDAPPFIIAKGDASLLKKPSISVVGSRNSSIHGNKIALELGKGLQANGYTIVSGMARGIDRQAHIGGMQSTIAVLANGIEQVYPPENKDIYEKILANGVIITESPVGTPPATHLFPGRNRIVAGLSVGTVVVEGTQHSGSLITANYALEYNREVFCVPGCPLDPRSYGPNKLIQNGAHLIQDYEDVLKHIRSFRVIDNVEQDYIPEPDESPTDLRECILELVSNVPTDIDEIYSNLDCSIAHLKQMLVELELEGYLKHCHANKVMRIR
jgi:DNA processing protein